MTRLSPEFDQRIADWLEDDPDRAPSQVTATVLAALPSIRQRRRGWFRAGGRTIVMPNSMRLVAVVAVLAIVGVGVIVAGSISQPPAPTPDPTASSAPSPAPHLTEGSLDPGRYRYDGTGIRVTVTVPAGWEGGVFSVGTGTEGPDGANLAFRQPTLVFGDPCDPEGTPELLGPTVEDLVTALSDLPNVTASPPAEATISGFSGTHLTFVVDTEGIDCVMGLYRDGAFIRAADDGQHQDLWILDVAGTRLVIDTATYPETPAEVRAQLQSMVDTLLIETR